MSKPLGNMREFVPALGNEALQVVTHTRRDRLPSHPSAHGTVGNVQVMGERCLPLRPVERSSDFDEKIERHWSPVVIENPKRAVMAGKRDIPAGLTVAGVGVKVEIVLRPFGNLGEHAAIFQPISGPFGFGLVLTGVGIPSRVDIPILVNALGVDGEQFPVIVTEFQPIPQTAIKAGFAVELTREILEILEHEFRVGFIGMNGATCRIEQFRRVAEIQVHPLTSDGTGVVLGISADIDGRRVIGNHRIYSLVSGLIAITAPHCEAQGKQSRRHLGGRHNPGALNPALGGVGVSTPHRHEDAKAILAPHERDTGRRFPVVVDMGAKSSLFAATQQRADFAKVGNIIGIELSCDAGHVGRDDVAPSRERSSGGSIGQPVYAGSGNLDSRLFVAMKNALQGVGRDDVAAGITHKVDLGDKHTVSIGRHNKAVLVDVDAGNVRARQFIASADQGGLENVGRDNHGSNSRCMGLKPGSGLIAIDASPVDWRRKKSGFDLVAPEITLAAKVLPNGGIAAESGNGPVEVFEVRNGVFHAFGLESQARVTNAFNVAAGNGFHGSNPSVVGLIATTASHTDWQGKESAIEPFFVGFKRRAIARDVAAIPVVGARQINLVLLVISAACFGLPSQQCFHCVAHIKSPISAQAIKHGAHNLIGAEFGEGSGTGGVIPASHAGVIPAIAGIAPKLADKVHLEGRVSIKRSLVSGSVFRGNHIGSPSHRRPHRPSNEPNIVLNSGRVNTEMQLAA